MVHERPDCSSKHVGYVFHYTSGDTVPEPQLHCRAIAPPAHRKRQELLMPTFCPFSIHTQPALHEIKMAYGEQTQLIAAESGQ